MIVHVIPGPAVARAAGWTRGSDVPEEEISWLWQDMIPLGGMTLIEGPPGCGKSTISRDLVARVTTGREMPGGHPACPGGALWCSSEEHRGAVLVPGLRRAGADDSRVFVLSDEGWETAAESVREMIAEHDVRVLVLDNVAVFLGPEGDDYLSVQKALAPWNKLSNETGIAIIGIRHTRKSGATNAVNAGIGSIAWAGVARATITVGQLDDGVSACALAKANLGPKPDPYEFTIHPNGTLAWLGRAAGKSADSITDVEAKAKRGSKKPNAKERLRAILEAGACPEVDVLEALKDLSEGTVRNAASSLGVVHDGPVWRLP